MHGTGVARRLYVAATFIDLQLCTDYKIGLPPEFAVLSRATTLIEAGLLPGKDIVAEVQPYAQRLLVSPRPSGRNGDRSVDDASAGPSA